MLQNRRALTPETGKMHSAAKDACITSRKNSLRVRGLLTARRLLKKFRA
jgi:hypothetical protein